MPLGEPCFRAFEIRKASLAFTSGKRGTFVRGGALDPRLPATTLIFGQCFDLGVRRLELHVFGELRLNGEWVRLLATLDHVPPPNPG